MNQFTFYSTAWEDLNQYPENATWLKQVKDDKHFPCKMRNTVS